MSIKKIIIVLLIGLIMVVANLVIHESGHALAAIRSGGGIASMEFFGLEVYPKIAYHGFSGFMGKVIYKGVGFGKPYGWVTLMGSGSTWIVSVLFLFALYALYFFKFRNFVLETIGIIGSLMFLDMLTYILGLRFTGLREPLVAVKYLGWDQLLFITLIFVFGSIQLALALNYIRISGYRIYFKITG